MAEYMDVMTQQKRMCRYYENKSGDCKGCPLYEEEIAYVCTEAPCAIEIEDIEQAEKLILQWAAEHPEPVYPTWAEWLLGVGGGVEKDIETGGYCGNTYMTDIEHYVVALDSPIPDDIARSMHIKAKEV